VVNSHEIGGKGREGWGRGGGEFRQKEKSKMKILKTKQLSGISIAIISETKSVKITRCFIFGFQFVAKNIEV
jgi:hypothetical protein